MRDILDYSPQNPLRIDTRTKCVVLNDEADEDQVMNSPLSELDDEEMVALSIAAGHVPQAEDIKRLDKMKTSNLTASKPTATTSKNTHTSPRRSQRAASKTATAKIKKGTKAQSDREEAEPERPKPNAPTHTTNNSPSQQAPKPGLPTCAQRWDEICSSASEAESDGRSTSSESSKISVHEMTRLVYRVAGQTLTYARFVEQRAGEGSVDARGAGEAAGRLFGRKRKGGAAGAGGGCVGKRVRFEG